MEKEVSIVSFVFKQKWLEVCSKKNAAPPGCELCQYQYIRHKKFVVSLSVYILIVDD